MEAFSRMMNVAMERELLTSFSMGLRPSKVMDVSHLLFADDALIFCEPEVEQIQNLRCLLLCFEAASSLKINMSKSKIVPIGAVGNLEVLSSILGCGVDSLPLTYLGLPLGYIPSFGLRPFIYSSLCLNTFTLDPLGLKPFMVCLSSKGRIL
jgi:hypothetical protein